MGPADISEVVAIERASYTMLWPERAYEYELRQNELAHYFVLRTSLPHPSLTKVDRPAAKPSSAIIGIGGFWLMADEIHISTIAIHPDWRRRGLGEWMLLTLIERGQALGGTTATLEVRPSNRVARHLYKKYDFRQAGRRRGYYTDNGEDALILTTPPLTLPDYRAMLGQRKAALFQKLAKIRVDKIGQIS